MRRPISLVLIVCFFLSGCSVTRQVTPNFPQALQKAQVVAVMPPQIKMFEYQAGGTIEEMDEWNKEVRNIAASAIDDYLKENEDMEVKFVDEQFLHRQHSELWVDTEVLYEAVAASAYVHTLSDQKFPTKIKNFDYTLGTDIQPMAESLDVDAFLFVYGYDYVSTTGRMALKTFNTLASTALSVFVGGVVVAIFPANSPSFLSMGLVDGKTGNLLWFKIIPPDSRPRFFKPKTFYKDNPMDAQRLKTRIKIILAALLFTGGCAATDLPSVNENGFSVLEDEERLFARSGEAIAFFERGGLLYEDQDLDHYLNGIYQKLLPEDLDATHLRPRIKVIDQPQTNAFALSNGQLYISTSMLTLMDSEAQLAAVIAHEMTHVLKRHALKVKRSTANKAAFFQSVSIIGPLAAFGAVSSISGYSRSVEMEADDGGLHAMLDHGYELTEAVTVYKNILQFNEDEDIKQNYFFSTHPALKSRIKSAKAFIDDHQDAQVSEPPEDLFTVKTQKVTQYTIKSWFQGGMYLAAEREIEQYLQDFPDDAGGYFLKGELYRQRQDEPVKGVSRKKDADYPIALEAYNQAIALDQNFAAAYKGQGILLLKTGAESDAKKAYQTYLRLKPDAPDFTFIQAMIEEDS